MKMQVFKIGTYVRCERHFIDMPDNKMNIDDVIPYLEKTHNLKFKCFNTQFMIFQKDQEIIKIDMDDFKNLLTI